MANKLNMAIAKTHRLSSRLVGMQITGGSFIAIALSVLQMSVGFMVVGAALIVKLPYVFGPLIALVGVMLALLVERLSIGGLSAIRGANERLQALRDKFYNGLAERKSVAEEWEQKHFDRQEKAILGERKVAIIFAGVGMVLSAGIGDLFWHFLFESLGWLSFVLSTACAAVIGLTFLHSELYKRLMDGVLREILSDMYLMKVAVANEGQSMELDTMVDAYDNVRNDPEVRKPAQDKIEKTVAKRLANFANKVDAISDHIDGIDSGVVGISETPRLQLPAPGRGKFRLHRDEVLRLVVANAAITDTEVAKHFGISRSTANSWIQKARNGQYQ